MAEGVHRISHDIWRCATDGKVPFGNAWKMESRDFLTMKKWLDAETLVKTQQPKCENLGGRVSRCGRHHIRSPH